MQDAQIVNALRTKSPDSVAELFDAYGEQLFQYCWLTLLSRDAAAAAVRDAMVVARANIATLRGPGQLAPWLYALARAECRRHDPATVPDADVPPGRTGQPDADSRLVAWRAVMSMSPADREALDLTARHGMSARHVGLVTGLSEVEADFFITQARARLQRALTAELAGARGDQGHNAPRDDRPASGHAAPRVVSVSKVFGRLPSPSAPPGLRDEVLAAAARREPAARREAPARHEAAAGSGLPFRIPRSRQLAAGLVAAGIAAVAVAVLWITGMALPSGTTSTYQAVAPVSAPSSEGVSSAAPAAPGQSAGPAPASRRPGRRHTRNAKVMPPVVGTGVSNQELYLTAAQPQVTVAAPRTGSAPAPNTVLGPAPSGPAPAPVWSTPPAPPGRATPPPTPVTSTTPTAPVSSTPTAGSSPTAPTTPAPPSTPTPTPTEQSPTPSSVPTSQTPEPSDSPSASPSPSAPDTASPTATSS
jgi:DNA-directed RNA polymerase specialized sigma24 family protein